METLGDKNQPKTSDNLAFKFYCKCCDYSTSKKCNYDSHKLTAKHKMVTNDYIKGLNSAIIQPKISQEYKEKFICSCGKEYQHRQGLWRHNKVCNIKESEPEIKSQESKKDDLIEYLIKENKEIKELILELAKKDTYNNNNNTTNNTNSHNKAFNLNFFLNETCKDAMNIMDFVDSIKLQLSDLERVGELGYVEGISNIIVKNLKDLDVTQRPVHCTDKKRETLYIKDEDKWEKDEERLKLHKVVRKVTCKNQNLIPKFKEAHPDCNRSSSKFSDQYNKIIVESMGGSGDNDYEKEEKIIKNISKKVFIEKEESL
jgi:hypothetical protein